MGVGVDVDRGVHDLVESSDFVKPEGVIDMVVCIEDGVNAGDFFAEDLLAQVWRGVDEDDAVDTIGIGELDGGAGSGAGVSGIGGSACGAIAGNDGDACRGAGAEEAEFHGWMIACMKKGSTDAVLVGSGLGPMVGWVRPLVYGTLGCMMG